MNRAPLRAASVFALVALCHGVAAAAPAAASPADTCKMLVQAINTCVANAAYTPAAAAGCASSLSKESAMCQQRAHALSTCEAKLTCEQLLTLHPTQCLAEENAYVADCGDRATSPKSAPPGVHGPDIDEPGFHSLGFHLRSMRRLLHSQAK